MSEQKPIVKKVKIIIGEFVVFAIFLGLAMVASYIKSH